MYNFRAIDQTDFGVAIEIQQHTCQPKIIGFCGLFDASSGGNAAVPRISRESHPPAENTKELPPPTSARKARDGKQPLAR
jgi:hypothetical protein